MSETEYGPIIPRRMYTTRLVGFVGKKRAGKTTAYQGLSCYKTLPLAEPIKKMIGALGVPYDCIYGSRKEEPLDLLCGKSARYAMQTLGTEWRHMIDDMLWLNMWWNQVSAWTHDGSMKYIIVDDVRFLKEADFMRSKGVVLIRVTRPGQDTSDVHASEVEQDQIVTHFNVVNDGTPQELQHAVRRILEGSV